MNVVAGEGIALPSDVSPGRAVKTFGYRFERRPVSLGTFARSSKFTDRSEMSEI
jgi:hypothetical protein